MHRKWRHDRIPGAFFVLTCYVTEIAPSLAVPSPILMRFFSLCTVTSCLQTQRIDRRNMCTIHTHARFSIFVFFSILARQGRSLSDKVDDVIFVTAWLDYKGEMELIFQRKSFGP